jgi:hypothetical protein
MSLIDDIAVEIQKPAYTGLTNDETLELLNAKTVSFRRVLTTTEIKQHAISQGYYANVKIASEDATSQTRNLCVNVLAWIDDIGGRLQSVNIDSDVATAMLTGLQQAGMMTSQQVSSLLALADVTERWCIPYGVSEIGMGHLINAQWIISNG